MIYLYGYTIFERFDGFDVLDISDGFKVGLTLTFEKSFAKLKFSPARKNTIICLFRV